MKQTVHTTAFFAAAAILLSAAHPSPPGATAPWRYAVVFHVVNGVRTYAGVTAVLPFSGRINALAATAKPTRDVAAAPAAGDDIWLAGNGTTQELHWNARAGTVRFVSAVHRKLTGMTMRFVNGSQISDPVRDDGTIAALVKSARPFLEPTGFGKAAHGPSASVGEGYGAAPPRSLDEMVEEESVIVRARVVAVLREQLMPPDDGPLMVTVFLVAVERYLSNPGPGAPGIIKVSVDGGDLPCRSGRSRCIGFRDLGQPMLVPGARYILFLRAHGRPSPEALQRGYYLSVSNGVRRKESEFDEYGLAEPWRGQILLEHGMTFAPQSEGDATGTDWKFDDGERLVGLPESIAEQEIEAAVRKLNKMEAAAGG
ncbi:MAG: hypothetical protein KGJ62_02245 [Armatimonadetes bacterium]|nr:hypothetical protein [Armatimonadota bacterium]MDE2205359.1 hypothetical protein [Armatimonadota bacterium]